MAIVLVAISQQSKLKKSAVSIYHSVVSDQLVSGWWSVVSAVVRRSVVSGQWSVVSGQCSGRYR